MSIYKRGNVWWLNVADRNGRQVRRSAKTRDRLEALRQEAALRLQLVGALPAAHAAGEAGSVFDIAGASDTHSVRFDRLMDEFMKHQEALGRRSVRSFFEVCVRDLRSYFKQVPIQTITARQVEEYVADRLRRMTVASVNRRIAVLRRAFNLAIRWGYTDRNPARGLDTLKEPKRVERVLSPAEQVKYLQACSEGYRTFAWVALRTGMRRGELQGLRVRDVDSWRSRISLPMTKAGSSRHIPILPKVAKTLEKLSAGKQPTDYLLTDVNGARWTHTMLRRRHRQAVQVAGLTWFRFHDLRHTFASDVLASGAPLHVIQGLLGHASVKTTEIYAHLAPGRLQEALQQYSSYLGGHITPHNTLDEVLELEGFKTRIAPN